MKKFELSETILSDNWSFTRTPIEVDSVTRRIEYLISNYFKYMKADSGGWYKLYQDPIDNRYWELTYPYSEKQGGAPTLQNLSREEVKLKYQL